MVLIRICHVADVPPPGDLVRKLVAEGQGAAPSSQPATQASPPPVPVMRAIAGGLAVQAAAPVPLPVAAPHLGGFRDVVALCSGRDPTLHSHLRHSVHLVRFAPGVIELRPEPVAPRDLASRLGALLLAETGKRWTIALSTAAGEPTLGEQEQSADVARRHAAADHPLVRAILDAFPGAKIAAVRDSSLDAYGLPALPAISLGEPDMPGFAPPDAEPADMMEDDT
jgi:DNA polymerase-3 subunit gamma/tau